MKVITLYQENSEPLILHDEDKEDKKKYAEQLSNLLSHHTITILETSHSVAIIRPSKVTSIKVDEEQNTKQESDKPNVPVPPPPVGEQEDIITDAD